MNETKRQNGFETLCYLASQCNPCWRIFCTTCGHEGFRYAFYQLALGRNPNDSDWINTFSQTDKKSMYKLCSYSESKPVIKSSEVLYEVFANASIANIANACWSRIHCDYLGYLGLALFHMEDIEYQQRRLTSVWGEDLLNLVCEESPAYLMLKSLLENDRDCLRWNHLELLENYHRRNL